MRHSQYLATRHQGASQITRFERKFSKLRAQKQRSHQLLMIGQANARQHSMIRIAG